MPTTHHPNRNCRVTPTPSFLCPTLRKCPNPFIQFVTPFSPSPSLHLLRQSGSLLVCYLDHQHFTLWFAWCGAPCPPSLPTRRQVTWSDLSPPRPLTPAAPPEGHTFLCTVLGIAESTGPNTVSLQTLKVLMILEDKARIVVQIAN